MSEMQEGIQMAMMTGQAMAFVVDKGVTLTRQILEALAKLMKMSALYTAVYNALIFINLANASKICLVNVTPLSTTNAIACPVIIAI